MVIGVFGLAVASVSDPDIRGSGNFSDFSL
jgi:hypothetical protein